MSRVLCRIVKGFVFLRILCGPAVDDYYNDFVLFGCQEKGQITYFLLLKTPARSECKFKPNCLNVFCCCCCCCCLFLLFFLLLCLDWLDKYEPFDSVTLDSKFSVVVVSNTKWMIARNRWKDDFIF